MRYKEAQPKDEHPMTEEWDEIKRRADEQGLLHNDGTFAFPPDGGSGALPLPCVDPRLIGDYHI